MTQLALASGFVPANKLQLLIRRWDATAKNGRGGWVNYENAQTCVVFEASAIELARNDRFTWSSGEKVFCGDYGDVRLLVEVR